jgi:hypothetical protein
LTPIERKYSRPRRKFTLPDSYSSSQRYEIDSLLGRGIETDELKEVDQRKPSSSAIIQTILVPMAIAKQLSVAGGENRSATVPVYEARRVSCIPLLRIEGSKDEEIKTEKCAENNLVVCTNKL